MDSLWSVGWGMFDGPESLPRTCVHAPADASAEDVERALVAAGYTPPRVVERVAHCFKRARSPSARGTVHLH